MKKHFIIKLRHPVPQKIVCWEDIISDKGKAQSRLTPEIDAVLQKYELPVWVAMEYRPRTNNWSADEIVSGFNRIYRLILRDDRKIPTGLLPEIRFIPSVEYVQPGVIGQAPIPQKDLATMTSLFPRDRQQSGIHLKEAHLFSKGCAQVKIAVLDTGVETTHPEIAHAMTRGKDFVDIIEGAKKFIGDYLDCDDDPEDEVGHGTHVSGILAGKGLNMPMGVVPGCKIMPVRVLGALKRGSSVVGAGLVDNINNGIKWAVDNLADVVNMSLGIRHMGGGLPHAEVIKYALRKGVTIVAASGNDGTDNKYYPGALPGVIAVGASDDSGLVAPFSTYGGHVSIIAPGNRIYSTFLNNTYAFSSGTSQASPFVTGAIALLKSIAISKGKSIGDRQIKYLLKHSSDKIDHRFKHFKAGFGRLNILDAIRLLNYKI